MHTQVPSESTDPAALGPPVISSHDPDVAAKNWASEFTEGETVEVLREGEWVRGACRGSTATGLSVRLTTGKTVNVRDQSEVRRRPSGPSGKHRRAQRLLSQDQENWDEQDELARTRGESWADLARIALNDFVRRHRNKQ